MAVFEEVNRLRLEGAPSLSEYGTVKNLTVARFDTSYVLLATFTGKYKKTPPEDLFIGSVRVVSVKESDERDEEVVQAEVLDEPNEPNETNETKDVNVPRTVSKK